MAEPSAADKLRAAAAKLPKPDETAAAQGLPLPQLRPDPAPKLPPGSAMSASAAGPVSDAPIASGPVSPPIDSSGVHLTNKPPDVLSIAPRTADPQGPDAPIFPDPYNPVVKAPPRAMGAPQKLAPSPVADRSTMKPFSPHAPEWWAGNPDPDREPIINRPDPPTHLPAPDNPDLPGPRIGKPVPYIFQESGTYTGGESPGEQPTIITPSRAYQQAPPLPFGEAFALSFLNGIGPFWSAMRGADIGIQAAKFGVDPTYHWQDDPQIKARPNMAYAVMYSQSARATTYILRRYDAMAEENASLAKMGLLADSAYMAGTFGDVASFTLLGELELPARLADAGLTRRMIYGVGRTVPAYVGAESALQGLASGLDASRPKGSFANGLLVSLGVGMFLGLFKGVTAAKPHASGVETGTVDHMAAQTDAVDPLDAGDPGLHDGSGPATRSSPGAPPPPDGTGTAGTTTVEGETVTTATRPGPTVEAAAALDATGTAAPPTETPAATGHPNSYYRTDAGFEEIWHGVKWKEAGGPEHPISPKGAAGVGQVMPNTARDIARELGDTSFPADAPRTPEGVKQIQAWLQQESTTTTLSGMSSVADGATIQRQANGSFAIIGKDGTREAGSLGANFISKDAAIKAAQAWDHRVQITEVPSGMTNSERYGRYYLRQQLEHFEDKDLALAAYNAGPQAVQDTIDAIGDPRLGQVSKEDFLKRLPAETQDYVSTINHRLAGGKDPETPEALAAVGDGETGGSTSTLASGDVGSPTPPRQGAPVEGGAPPGEPPPAHGPETVPMDRVTFVDEKGKTVLDPGEAAGIRIAGQKLPIAGVTILDDDGKVIHGPPMTDGTPAVHSGDLFMVDAAGNPVSDINKATHVLLNGDYGAYNHFDFLDAAGNRLASHEGATHVRRLPEDARPMIPRNAKGKHIVQNLGRWIWRNKTMIGKHIIEGIVEEGVEPYFRIQKNKEAPTDLVDIRGSVGARRATVRGGSPGRTNYRTAARLQGNTMKSAFGLEKIAPTPNLRLANSPFAMARYILERLTEPGWSLDKNGVGRATSTNAFSSVRADQGQANMALRNTMQRYWDYVQRVSGRRQNFLERGATTIWGTSGVMSLKQFLDEVGKAKRYAGTADAAGLLPEAIEAAAEYDRRIYKPYAQRIDDSKLLIEPLQDQLVVIRRMQQGFYNRGLIRQGMALEGKARELEAGIRSESAKMAAGGNYRPDYLHRVWDQRAVATKANELMRILRNFGRTPDEARLTVEAIGKAQPFMPFGPDSVGRAAALHQRTLADIPDKALEAFLVHDINVVTQSYVKGTGSDLARAEHFNGDVNLERHIDHLKNEISQAIAAEPDRAKRAALAKLGDQAVQDVRDLRDMQAGTFGLSANPQAFTSRAIRVAKQFNALTQLTGFISSIPDLARVPMVYGINHTIGATLDALSNGMAGLKMARNDAILAGESADFVNALHAGGLSHVSDSFAATSKVERVIQHVASLQPALDFTDMFQDRLKSWASVAAGTEMLGAMERFVANRATRSDMQKLASSYIGFVDDHGVIDDAMIRRMVDQYHQHGLNTGRLKVANTDLWHDDPQAANLFQQALGREIRNTIAGGMTPGNIPTWMSTEMGSLLGQYRSYGFTAMSRILIPGLQGRDRQFLAGIVSMVGLGMIVDRMQSTARGENWDSKPWIGKLVGGLDRSGALGWMMDADNAMEAITFGQVGLRPSLGIGGHGDLGHAVGALAGPTGSTAFNVFNSVFGNPADPATRQAQQRLIPLHNIWQAKALMGFIGKEQGNRGQGPPLQ